MYKCAQTFFLENILFNSEEGITGVLLMYHQACCYDMSRFSDLKWGKEDKQRLLQRQVVSTKS